MIRKLNALAVVICAVRVLPSNALAQEIKTVMIVKNEIAVKINGNAMVRLTHDGSPKALPVWSKDGARIAFFEHTNEAQGLGKLMVIASDGNIVSETPIKPISAGQVQTGMRSVESLEWITPGHIAISGSVNPSTTEYNVVDLLNPNVSKQFFDDGHGAGFAPGGRHFAYVTGSPHFTPPDQRVPALIVDDRAIYIAKDSALEFSGTPAWSQNDRSIAITTNLYGEEKVIIWREGQKSAESIPSPVRPTTSPPSIFWKDDHLYLTITSSIEGRTDQTWVLEGQSWRPVDSKTAPNIVSDAEGARKRLVNEIAADGGQDPDFWCESCDLNVLPRASGRR